MTLQIGLTLAILFFAVVLFITERIRVDLVALLVLGLLALTGLVTPQEAISGFSNPAVVTVWAVFVLSGGMSRTGVANIVGQWMIRVAGQGEVRLMVTIMVVGGVMSAFMNNVGVVALLLPVVINIARQTGHQPSRLLMPLATGSLLGGMMTLIGTPPNILASDALRDAGFPPFGIFDFAPVGVTITVAGVLFMVLIGRRLLPSHGEGGGDGSLGSAMAKHAYQMGERLSVVQIPEDSPLDGMSLEESRLGTALGLTILQIDRKGRDSIIPELNTRLQGGDRLTVAGRLDMLENLKGGQFLEIEGDFLTVSDLVDESISMVEVTISPRSKLLGKSLLQLDFRKVYGVIVLAMWRNGSNMHSRFDSIPLEPGDTFLVQGEIEHIKALRSSSDFLVSGGAEAPDYELDARLRMVRIPPGSPLEDKPLAQSRLSEAAGLAVLGIVRNGTKRLLVNPQDTLQPGDRLIVKGNAEQNLDLLQALQNLIIERGTGDRLSDLESEDATIVEAVLSPHSTLPGTTLRQIDFRRLYGVNVLSILREGRAYRSDLANISLRFGDTFLLHGSRDRLNLLSKDRNFILLTDEIAPSPRIRKAPLAVGIMLSVVVSVMVGWLPISIAAVIGASLIVLTGCLSMEEAYREIDWRAVFLIAGMLPLGIAMDSTGTASLLANGVVTLMGNYGITALIAGLFVLTTMASQVMPNPVVTVLMAPIALTTAANLNLSPPAVIMVVAIGASASFLSPVGHPANVLIMGPGGYRFKDYTRVGLPLTLVVMVVTLLVLPIFWPYTP